MLEPKGDFDCPFALCFLQLILLSASFWAVARPDSTY